MENALQFELTGENDQGSGTSLNTASAPAQLPATVSVHTGEYGPVVPGRL